MQTVLIVFIHLAAMGKTAVADGAAAFMAKKFSAFGAMEFVIGSKDRFVCGLLALSFFWCRLLLRFGIETVVAEHLAHLDNGSCNSIRAGSAFESGLTNGAGAADSFKLGKNLVLGNSRAKSDRNKSCGCFALGRTAAAFSGAGENFANSVFIAVNGDEKASAADLHLFGCAPGKSRSGSRNNGVHCRNFRFLFLFFLGPDGKNLAVAASVTINGGAFASEFICKNISFLNFFAGCAVGEVYGFGNGVVGIFLECRLDSDMPFGSDIVCADENSSDIFGISSI